MRRTSVASLFPFLFLSLSFLRFGIFAIVKGGECEIRSARCAPPLTAPDRNGSADSYPVRFARPEGAPERRIRSFVRSTVARCRRQISRWLTYVHLYVFRLCIAQVQSLRNFWGIFDELLSPRLWRFFVQHRDSVSADWSISNQLPLA